MPIFLNHLEICTIYSDDYELCKLVKLVVDDGYERLLCEDTNCAIGIWGGAIFQGLPCLNQLS